MASRDIPETWEGNRVLVVHPVQMSGSMSVGNTPGTLEKVNDRGIVLRAQEPGRDEELHFFPWASIIKVIQEAGQEESPRRSGLQMGRA